MDSARASGHPGRPSEQELQLDPTTGAGDKTHGANKRGANEDGEDYEPKDTLNVLPHFGKRSSGWSGWRKGTRSGRGVWCSHDSKFGTKDSPTSRLAVRLQLGTGVPCRSVQDRNDNSPSPQGISKSKLRWLKLALVALLLLAVTLALMVVDSTLAIRKGEPIFDLSGTYMRPNNAPAPLRPQQDMFSMPALLVIRPPMLPPDDSTIDIDETPNPNPPAWRLSDKPSRLPKCKKIMVCRIDDLLGWGAGLLLINRLDLIAARVGAVLLIDNGAWCYGRLEYYFEPYKIDCVPPEDWYDEKLGHKISEKGWETSERIIANWQHRAAVGAYEDEVARADLDVAAIQRLSDLEFGDRPRPSVLPGPETLPLPMIPAFEAQSKVLKKYWKPLPETLAEVKKVKKMMGIGGSQPTVAVMIRLGDKGWEYRHSLRPSNVQNTFKNLSAHLEVMHDLYDRMVPPEALGSDTLKPWYPLSSHSRLFSPEQQPIAIVVTAEENALLNISHQPIAAPFRFDRIPSLIMNEGSYRKAAFIRWPMSMRVAHTRQLVRDIEIMAKETDATVVTMSSNIGRIVTMLAGTEAALGPVDAEGNHVGGRVRALDVWWFPREWPWLSLAVVGWKGEKIPRRPTPKRPQRPTRLPHS